MLWRLRALELRRLGDQQTAGTLRKVSSRNNTPQPMAADYANEFRRSRPVRLIPGETYGVA